MASTVFVEGKPVATQGTGHAGLSKVDKIKPAGKPPAVPYVNVAWSADVEPGSCPSKTVYKGAKIWTEASVIPKSVGAGGPPGPGDPSQTWQSQCTAKATQTSVLVQGKLVIRLDDPTKQNNNNCDGQVVEGPVAAAALEEARKKGAGAPGDDDAGAPKAPQKTDPPKTKAPPEKKTDAGNEGSGSSTQTDVPCSLRSIEVGCKHDGRKAANRLLEVVPSFAGDPLTLKATMSAAHGPEHPAWHIRGYASADSQGASSAYLVAGWSSFGAAAGTAALAGVTTAALNAGGGAGPSAGTMAQIGAVIGFLSVTPRTYEITCEACAGEKQRVTVKCYPYNEVKAELAFGPLKKLLEEALGKDGYVKKAFGATGIKKWQMALFHGSASVSAAWKEGTNEAIERPAHTTYAELSVLIGFDPLFGVGCEFSVPLGPLGPVQKVIEFLELGELAVFVYWSFSVSAKAGLVRKRRWTGKGLFEVEFQIGVGARCSVAGTLKIESTISAAACLSVTVEGTGTDAAPKSSAEFILGEVKGSLTLEVSTGRIGKWFGLDDYEKKWEIVLLTGLKWDVQKKEPLW